jgi:hypothetical protein
MIEGVGEVDMKGEGVEIEGLEVETRIVEEDQTAEKRKEGHILEADPEIEEVEEIDQEDSTKCRETVKISILFHN